MTNVNDQSGRNEHIYWALKQGDDIASELTERIRDYYYQLRTSGLIRLWWEMHASFYGLDPTSGAHEGSTIIEFGDDGEKLGVRSNQLRSLIRYMLATATADRPAVNPKAVNTTAKALAQVPIARKILEYYQSRRGLERTLVSVCLRALIYAKGYLWQTWDPSATTPVGGLVHKALGPLEVVCDLEREAYDHDWFIIRRPRNRYDLAAIFASGPGPDQEELRGKILDVGRDVVEDGLARSIAFGLHRHRYNETDTVYEYHFMHRRTPALPAGRYMILLGESLVLFDGELPFEDLPISEMVPEEFLDVPALGYSSGWDLLGLQQAYDAVLSTCLTNFDAFGTNDIMLPNTSELSVEELRDGLNVLRHTPGDANRPEILQKFSIKDEAFKLKDWVRGDMELNLGINSVARGDPEASLRSGSALALIQAQAVHFQGALVAAYVRLVEDSSTITLRILKAFAPAQTIAAIAGSGDGDGLVAFSSSDIDKIDRVECELGNPIFRTTAGKFDTANNLLERGLIKNVQEYFQVLESGRLEPVTDPSRKESLFARSVVEALSAGPQVVPGKPDSQGQPTYQIQGLPVVITDNPSLCIAAAKSVLDSLENRKNPAVVQAATAYIMEALRVWRSAPVDLLSLLGIPIPPPPEAAGMQPAGGAGAAPTQTPQQEPPNGKGEQSNQQAPDQGSGMPSLPKPAQPPSGTVK